jgi:hypothetical protein
MTTQSQAQSTKGWHVGSWGFWGWLETAVKGVGIITGLVAFTMASPSNPMQLTGVPNLIAIGILGLLTLTLALVVFVRISQREIISLIFSIANALGHAGLLFYLVRTPDGNVLPLIFGLAFIAGETIKQRFLTITGYTENGAQTPQMLLLVRGLTVMYLIFTVLILI